MTARIGGIFARACRIATLPGGSSMLASFELKNQTLVTQTTKSIEGALHRGPN